MCLPARFICSSSSIMRSPRTTTICCLCSPRFRLFLLINTGANLIRAKLLAHAQSALAFQMGAGLFRHLLRLPLAYFEKRHVGDLVSRFSSTEPVRNLLAEGLVTAIIDGAMASADGGHDVYLSAVVGSDRARRAHALSPRCASPSSG